MTRLTLAECQRPHPRSMPYYSAPQNDVWSLGVILVNLTCGRNPWKRASTDDSTFRAYLRDPYFLKSILPLSDEMVCILSRIFEVDPSKRITIPALRQLILDCPRFTLNPITPWGSNSGPLVNHIHPPQAHAPVFDALNTQPSTCSSDSSQYSDSFSSAVSDTSSYTEGYPDMDSVSSLGPEPETHFQDDFPHADSIACSDLPEYRAPLVVCQQPYTYLYPSAKRLHELCRHLCWIHFDLFSLPCIILDFFLDIRLIVSAQFRLDYGPVDLSWPLPTQV